MIKIFGAGSSELKTSGLWSCGVGWGNDQPGNTLWIPLVLVEKKFRSIYYSCYIFVVWFVGGSVKHDCGVSLVSHAYSVFCLLLRDSVIC